MDRTPKAKQLFRIYLNQASSADSWAVDLSSQRRMKLPVIFLSCSIGLFPVYGLSQTGPSPTSGSATAEPTKTNLSQTPEAQPATNSTPGGQNASSSELSQVVVVGQLDTVRDEIVPSLGATKYTIGQPQIQNESQGSNAPFNKVILQAPGVAQDSYGQLHVRDEHANLQFRIDDVLIPEGITGFGQEIDTPSGEKRRLDHWFTSGSVRF